MSIFVIASTDSGAPAVSGTNGTFITLLDYAAVTIAGYTKTFTGTNKGIYKPPYGLGYSVRVVHDSAISGAAGAVTVRGVESATGIDTFVNPYPTPLQIIDSLAIWGVSTTNNATARPYIILISDGAPGGPPPFIYFLSDLASTGAMANNAWGEASPVESVDNYCSYVSSRNSLASNGSSTATSLNSATVNNGTVKLYWARSRDGSVVSSQGCFYNPLNSYGSMFGGYTNGPNYPHPDTGGLHMQKVAMTDFYSNQNAVVGYASNQIRAFCPNFWNALHGTAGYTGIANYDTFELDTASTGGISAFAQFLFLTVGTSGANAGIYETTSTWSAP